MSLKSLHIRSYRSSDLSVNKIVEDTLPMYIIRPPC
jgi:hypothetical protein